MRANTEGNVFLKNENSKKPGGRLPSTLRTTSTVNNEDITTTNNDLFSHNFERRNIPNTSEFAVNKEDTSQKLHTFSFVKYFVYLKRKIITTFYKQDSKVLGIKIE